MRCRLLALVAVVTLLFFAVLAAADAPTPHATVPTGTTGWLRASGGDESNARDDGASSLGLTPRAHAASVVVPFGDSGSGERLVLLGGHMLPEDYLADVFVSDVTPSADAAVVPPEWTNLHTAANPTPWPARYGAVAIRADASDPLNPRILLIGGVGAGLTPLGDVWSASDSSFRAESWERLSTNNFTGRSHHCAAALDQGRTVVVWAGHPLEADTWRSEDGGRTFERQPISYWRNRFGAACVVTTAEQTGLDSDQPTSSTETIWMVGGETDNRRPTTEVWFSRDRGTTWTLQGLYSFPGAARSYAAATFGRVALAPPGVPVAASNGSTSTMVWALVIHGGQSKAGWPHMLNDSWATEDLRHWRRIAPTPEGGRSGHALLVDGRGRLTMATGQRDFGSDSGTMESGMETADVLVYLGEPLPPANTTGSSASSSSSSSVDTVLEAIFWFLKLAFLLVGLTLAAHRFWRRAGWNAREGEQRRAVHDFEAVPTDGPEIAEEDQTTPDEVEMQPVWHT